MQLRAKTDLSHFHTRKPRGNESFVVNRSGLRECVRMDKITDRVIEMCSLEPQIHDTVDPFLVTLCAMRGFKSGMTTTELDTEAAEACVFLQTTHPDYYTLGSRLFVSNSQKQIGQDWIQAIRRIKAHQRETTPLVGTGTKPSIHRISSEFFDLAEKYHADIACMFKSERDYIRDYFAHSTINHTYAYKIDGIPAETPQHVYMRVALSLYKDDLENVKKTYNYLSKNYYTHATPTLANAGKEIQQLASCFLLSAENTTESTYTKIAHAAILSSNSGGIGLDITDVSPSIQGRAPTKRTNVEADPQILTGNLGTMLTQMDDMPKTITQGTSGRNAAIAAYMDIWHCAVPTLVESKAIDSRNEYVRKFRNLFLGIMNCDLFMQRVSDDESWSLFYPDTVPGLNKLWGDAFETQYEIYESAGIAYATVKARDLWLKIINTQIPSGLPYLINKDSVNRKNNQSNLGTIRTSNLCTEIMEFTSEEEIAVCNLATICLSSMVRVNEETKVPYFDFKRLEKVATHGIKSLNRVISVTHYPVADAKRSNIQHKPVGLGVQGLADAFMQLRLPFESEGAKELNKHIFEVIYYAALKESCEEAKRTGTYSSFAGSPISKGIFQFDLWGVVPTYKEVTKKQWDSLREAVKKYGVANSLLVTIPPTATTSSACGNYECIEPLTSNQYIRRTSAGDFVLVNKYLLKDLLSLGIWDKEMQEALTREYGSVQNIDRIPKDLKELYKTVWEISQKTVIDLAVDRGAFIDQSQSMNIHIAAPTVQQMHSLHMYAWKQGLKTGMYYLRTLPNVKPVQATVPIEHKTTVKIEESQRLRFAPGSAIGSSCSADGSCDA